MEKKSFVIARLYIFSSNSIFDFACSFLVVSTIGFLSLSFVIVDDDDCALMRSKKKTKRMSERKKEIV